MRTPKAPFSRRQDTENNTCTDFANSCKIKKGKACADSSAQDKKGGIEMQGSDRLAASMAGSLRYERKS